MRIRNGPADAGFTLVEVVTALAVIGVVMTAVTTFFVRSMVTVNVQGARQAAIQVASDEMEHLRELPGSSVLAWLQAQNTNQNTRTVGGIVYTTTWSCTALTGAGAPKSCAATDALIIPKVQVSWRDRNCTGGTCGYAAVTQVSTSQTEPIFDPAAS